jgi:hypothetical protein
MKYYDARIIEGCCVFSYEVKTPDRSRKKRKKSSGAAWKKIMLRFLFFLLLPFAFLIDSAVMGATKIFNRIRSFLCGYVKGYVFVTGILSSVTVTAVVPLLLRLF